MAEMIIQIKTAYAGFDSAIFPLILAILALIYLIAKSEHRFRSLAIYGITVLVILVCPVLANRLIGLKAAYGNSWQIWGILAPVLLAAVVGTDFIVSRKPGRQKAAGILVIVLCIYLSVGIIPSMAHMDRQAVKEAKELATVLVQNADEGQDIVLLAPQELAQRIKENEPSIRIYTNPFIIYNQADVNAIASQITLYQINCVAIEAAYDNEEFFSGQGFSKSLASGNYCIYTKN